MTRKKCVRIVANEPGTVYYKPIGIPCRMLTEIVIHVDEYEAIRLADHHDLYHEEAAERMQVSRATFGRILSVARSKIADAMVNGKAIKIEGGNFTLNEDRPCHK